MKFYFAKTQKHYCNVYCCGNSGKLNYYNLFDFQYILLLKNKTGITFVLYKNMFHTSYGRQQGILTRIL